MEQGILTRLLRPDILGVLVGMVAVIGFFWYRSIKTRSENDLKRSMVEQGMSAEEIERVLKAKSSE